MARKSKAFLKRSRAAKKAAKTRAINKEMYAQLLQLEKRSAAAKKGAKTREYIRRARVQTPPEDIGHEVWEIEIGMSYGKGD